ncbi:MAG: hypothetical protein ACFFED_00955 [Candidatus Thorarchaeota archaeon]
MNSTEMMERFRRFVHADLSHIVSNRRHQLSEILLETSTVRIILTRYVDKIDDIEVDIEASLPSLSATSDTSVIQETIDRLIAILEYLKNLGAMGFSLEIFEEEGILTASGFLKKNADEELFKALEPPELSLGVDEQ